MVPASRSPNGAEARSERSERSKTLEVEGEPEERRGSDGPDIRALDVRVVAEVDAHHPIAGGEADAVVDAPGGAALDNRGKNCDPGGTLPPGYWSK